MHCWARPGVQYHCESIRLTISGTTVRSQWACHQVLLNALACSVFWSPPDVVHHWGCRLASLHWEISNLRCPWAPKPHVHLPVQRLVLGSFHWDRAVRASTGFQVMTRLASGRGSWAWEHMMHQQAACHWNATCYHTSLAICAILSERSEGGQPLRQRIMRPRKSNNRTLRNDKWCSWRGQFELGNPWYANELSMTDFAQDGILPQVGMGGCIGLFGAYSLIPPTTCPCGKFTWWHWRLSRTPGSLTFVSETTKHTLLQWACNRHLSMVELPHATRQAGKTEPGDLLHHRQGLLLDHSGKKGVSSRITFESSGLWKQE